MYYKLDWRLLPYVSIIHLLSFLDRTNFGNAKVAGMQKDLKLGGYRYNIAASLFYITYCLFELPSNLLMKKIGPAKWFPLQCVIWGVVTTCFCAANKYSDLLALRIFLGVTEAGLFPGINYYLSLWYPRNILAKRIAIFYASTTSSGAFSGILTYGIVKLDGKGGFHGWQWIFLIEGVITIAFGLVGPWLMYDLPENSSFITPKERERIEANIVAAQGNMPTNYKWQYVVDCFKDPKTWLYAIIYLGGSIGVYSNSLFLPTIIKGLGKTDADAQLYTVPPYAVAMFGAFFNGYISDRLKLRFPFVMLAQLTAIVGYAIVRGTTDPDVAYGGMFLAVTGVYSTVPVLIAWASGNTAGDTKRASQLAIMIGFGNLGGICASFIYRVQDSPRYELGHDVVISVICMSFTCSGLMALYLNYLNKKKAANMPPKEQENEYREMGDRSPFFRYYV
ncbi:MFS general substrate transporter [Atractiella rhizophila]|nr:MFS general substrate transporter [Atractiella rhizophila]